MLAWYCQFILSLLLFKTQLNLFISLLWSTYLLISFSSCGCARTCVYNTENATEAHKLLKLLSPSSLYYSDCFICQIVFIYSVYDTFFLTGQINGRWFCSVLLRTYIANILITDCHRNKKLRSLWIPVKESLTVRRSQWKCRLSALS